MPIFNNPFAAPTSSNMNDLAAQRQRMDQMQMQRPAMTNSPVGNVAGLLANVLAGVKGRKIDSRMNEVEEQKKAERQATMANVAAAMQGGKPEDMKVAISEMIASGDPQLQTMGMQMLQSQATDERRAAAVQAAAVAKAEAEQNKKTHRDVEENGRLVRKYIQNGQVVGATDLGPAKKDGEFAIAEQMAADRLQRIADKGNIEPTTPATTDLQKRQINNDQILAGLDNVASSYSEEFLTYQGQFKDWMGQKAERAGLPIGEAWEQFIIDKSAFASSVEGLFNDYRRVVTGAAAAVAELDRLKKAMINMDMSPSQFKGHYGAYRAHVERLNNAIMKVQQEGLNGTPVEPGTEAFGKAVDMEMTSKGGGISLFGSVDDAVPGGRPGAAEAISKAQTLLEAGEITQDEFDTVRRAWGQ